MLRKIPESPMRPAKGKTTREIIASLSQVKLTSQPEQKAPPIRKKLKIKELKNGTIAVKLKKSLMALPEKAILLDLDDTLINIRKSQEQNKPVHFESKEALCDQLNMAAKKNYPIIGVTGRAFSLDQIALNNPLSALNLYLSVVPQVEMIIFTQGPDKFSTCDILAKNFQFTHSHILIMEDHPLTLMSCFERGCTALPVSMIASVTPESDGGKLKFDIEHGLDFISYLKEFIEAKEPDQFYNSKKYQDFYYAGVEQIAGIIDIRRGVRDRNAVIEHENSRSEYASASP